MAKLTFEEDTMTEEMTEEILVDDARFRDEAIWVDIEVKLNGHLIPYDEFIEKYNHNKYKVIKSTYDMLDRLTTLYVEEV